MKTKMFVLYDGMGCPNDDLTEVVLLQKEYEWDEIKDVIDSVNCDEECDNKYDEIYYQLEEHFGKLERIRIYDTDFIAEF